MGEFNVDKTTGGLNPTAGMPDTYPAEQVMMSDGTTSVEEALDEIEDGLHWQFVDTITNSHSVTVPVSHEVLFVAFNESFGTAFGSLTIPASSLPAVINIVTNINETVTITRSGATFSTSATAKAVKVYRR